MGHINEEIKKTIEKIPLTLSDASFLTEVEKSFSSEGPFTLPFSLIKADNEALIRVISLYYAKELISSKFEKLSFYLQKENLVTSKKCLGEALEFLDVFLKYQFQTLASPSLQKLILNLKKPLLNYRLEQLIRLTLRKKAQEKIQDLDIQILCLSAFLHPLRQSVGSCFATAPAIQVQLEQPELFFKDLQDLLHLGQIRRVNENKEQTLPMSFAFAPRALKEKFKPSNFEHFCDSLEIKAIAEHEQWYTLEDSEENRKNRLQEKCREIHFNQSYCLEDLIEIFLAKRAKRRVLDDESHLMTQRLSAKSEVNLKLENAEDSPGYFSLHLQLHQLYDHLLLKSWEYTLASFSESKAGFYKWNLYTSLGLQSEEKGGLGEAIYQYLEKTVEEGKLKLEEYHRKYEEEFYQVKFLESRLKNTEDTQMGGWARVEYQSHIHEMNRWLNAREDQADLIEKISKLLPKFVQALDRLFPEYFLELYDAKMQDFSHPFYEDAPAGFRLIYKHGRSDPSVWTFIRDKEGYISSIKDFFLLIENEIKLAEEFKGLESQMSDIITVIVRTLQSEAFIESAYQRVCARYHYAYNSSQDKSSLPFKPWSYLSGGTLSGLLQHYFEREKTFSIRSQKVASPLELCSFLIDTLRDFPPKTFQKFIQDPMRSLLMTSPNHAFLFKPGLLPLKEIWEERNLYSYTWIRDEWMSGLQRFIASIEVQPAEMVLFIDTYLGHHPYLANWFKNRIHLPNYSLSLVDFKKLCSQHLHQLPSNFSSKDLSEELIDSWLYEFFPFTPHTFLKARLDDILDEFDFEKEKREKIDLFLNFLLLEKCHGLGLSSLQLFNVIKASFLASSEELLKSADSILKAMQKHKVSMPEPLFWADTNWPYYHFAFFLDLQTLKPSLWCMERWGRKGFPMRAWEPFFSEKNPSTWSIYTKAEEYTYTSKKLSAPKV